MKPIITINAADIVAAVLLCICLAVLILGKLVVFLHIKIFKARRRRWKGDEE